LGARASPHHHKKNATPDKKEGGPDKTKPGKSDIHHPPVEVKFNKTVVDIQKKAAIDHKPLLPIDPKTKKAIPDDHELTLPSGKKVKVGEYYTELNKLEKKLNSIGHSLRHNGKVTLATSQLKTAELEQKAKAIAAKHVTFDAKTMKRHVKREQMQAKFKESAQKDKARVEALKKLLSKTPDKGDGKSKVTPRSAGTMAAGTAGTSKNWHWELGRRNLVAAFLDAKVETRGSKQEVSVTGEAEAGGYLVNNKVSLLKATGSVRAPAQGESHARISVSVVGKTIFNKDYPAKTNYSISDTKSTSVDKSVSFHFMLGPIPLSVKLGAQGTVGVRYFVGLRPLYAEAQFIPFANARAYAQAGIDIVVASGGVGGQLKLLDVEFRIGGKMVVNFDPSKGASLEEQAYVWSKIDMLSGSLYVYAEVYVPRLGLPPWKKNHYEWDLWKWKGFSTSRASRRPGTS
jgi:hypothetical protein